MLLLLFETHDGRYALDSKYIVEIIPLLRAKKIPSAPGYVAGMINYHGLPVPVLDICAMEGGEVSRPLYSTRIVLVPYTLDGEEKLIGMIVERATDVIKCSESDIRSSGILLDKNLFSRQFFAGIFPWFNIMNFYIFYRLRYFSRSTISIYQRFKQRIGCQPVSPMQTRKRTFPQSHKPFNIRKSVPIYTDASAAVMRHRNNRYISFCYINAKRLQFFIYNRESFFDKFGRTV